MDNRRTSSLIHISRAKKTYRSTRNKNGWPNQGTEVRLVMWSPIFSQRQKHMLQLHQTRLIWAKGTPAYLQGSLCVIKCPPCAQGLNTTAEVSRSEAQRHRKLLAIYWVGFLLWGYELFLETLYGVKIQNIHQSHSISWRCYTSGSTFGWHGEVYPRSNPSLKGSNSHFFGDKIKNQKEEGDSDI